MEKTKNKETATDMELALLLIQHIQHPCEDSNGNNIRHVYLEEAQRALKTMKDPDAKKLLADTINETKHK
jgi:hypothetical protein